MFLNIDRFNPALLRGWKWTTYPYNSVRPVMESRRVHEYEIEYFTRSDGGIRIDGAYVPFTGGDINFRRPGQIVQGVAPYACLTIVIDLTGNRERANMPDRFGAPDSEAPYYTNSLLDSIPARLPVKDARRMEQLMLNLVSSPNKSDEQRYASRILLMQLFQTMFHDAQQRRAVCPASVRSAYEKLCQNYTTPLRIQELVDESGLSKAYFHAAFREFAGCTPVQLVTQLRMELAQAMLNDSRMTVGDIAMWCGYDDASYFTRVFRSFTSYSPTQWREMHGG